MDFRTLVSVRLTDDLGDVRFLNLGRFDFLVLLVAGGEQLLYLWRIRQQVVMRLERICLGDDLLLRGLQRDHAVMNGNPVSPACSRETHWTFCSHMTDSSHIFFKYPSFFSRILNNY